MRTLTFLPAVLVLCAFLGATPATANWGEQGAVIAGAGDETAERADRSDDADDDAYEDASDDGNEDGISDALADDASDPDDARPRTKKQFERKRYLHASAERKAVRRIASVQHRRVYRYHRYLRSAGPFYRKNLRRRPSPAEYVEDRQ